MNNSYGKLQFLKDTNFGDPWVNVMVQVRTRRGLVDKLGAHAVVLATLAVQCMVESFRTPAYPYEQAGLRWEVKRTHGTDIWLSVNGANPSITGVYSGRATVANFNSTTVNVNHLCWHLLNIILPWFCRVARTP